MSQSVPGVSLINAQRRRRGRLLLVGVAAILTTLAALTLGPVARADAPPTTRLEQVQALVQPGVVYEQITWTAWAYDETNKQYFTDEPFTATFQCTGFVVNPDGYIGTAGHCVEFREEAKAAIIQQVIEWTYDNDYYEVTPSRKTIATFAQHWRLDGENTNGKPDLAVAVAYGVSVSGEPSGKELPARVVGFRAFDDGDVALLKIDAENLTVMPLSSNESTGVGTEIVAVGYPASVDLVTDETFDPSFKEGSISAEKTTAGGLLPVYEISAAVSGGMSGGPTTALDGQVIGVNSFGISGEPQAFNFVQPSQTLEELMRSEGVQNTSGEVTDLYRSGLDAYFAGDRDPAIASFDKVLQIVPNHEFAQEYKRKAQNLPESTRILGLPLWLLGLLALLAVAVVIGVLVLLLRRKGPAPAAGAVAGPPSSMPPPVPGTVPVAAGGASSSEPEMVPAPEPSPTQVIEPVEAEAPPAPAAPESAPPVGQPGETDALETPRRFCPNCGAEHAEGAHFCESCGHRLV